MKKIISLLLAACLLLSMTAGALAANWTPTLDKTAIKAGEEVKVTVSLDEPMTDITTVGYDLYFDDELFTYKEDSFTISEELKAETYLLPEISAKLSNEDGSYHSLNFINPKECFDISAGEVCSLVFVANADLKADASASFELKLVAVLDDFYEEVSGHGAGKAASITVTANKTEPEPPAGAVIPAGAPFTAITTDEGAVITIEDKGMSGDYANAWGSSYGSAPYYHVTIPEGASSVSVTYPAEQDPFVTYSSYSGAYEAYGYYADVESWTGDGITINGYTQDDAGNTTVAFPLTVEVQDWMSGSSYEVSFLLNEDGSGNAAAIQKTSANSNAPIAFFSFSYAAVPGCSHSETETAYAPVDGKEEHTVTVSCKSCTETLGEVSTEPCSDENGDKQCDKCFGTVLPAGYYVSLNKDTAISAGEHVNLEIAVGNRSEESYNAYYFTVSYDHTILSYTGSASGVANDGENGVLTIAGYGEDRACGTDTIALPFQAVGIGEAAVSVTAANVDKQANANSQDTPKAAILDGSVTVTVGGYTVSLHDDFRGAGTVGEGKDYTFTAKDLHYDYSITATMGGESVTVTDNGDGSYTIANVTGNLVIGSSKTPKSYPVTVSGNAASEVTAADTATYGTDYSFTVTEDGVSTYTVTVLVGGQSFSATRKGSSYTIPGASVTGAVEITVSKRPPASTTTSVSFSGEGSGDLLGDTTQSVTNGQPFTFNLDKAEGYVYTVMLDGQELKPNADGSYTIPGAKLNGRPLTVSIEKTAEEKVEIAVTEYLTVDESVLWLVTAAGAPEGTVMGYDGSAMYWSDKYEAYAWLVFSAESEANVLSAARAAVAPVSAEKVSVAYKMDVNHTGLVDPNHAQTVYNMYNASITSFDGNPVSSFLEADVNGSKSINVDDAAAIINAILKIKA